MRASASARSCEKPRFLDLLARDDLRLFGLAVALGAVLGEFDALRGAAALDVVLLREPRIFGLALDLERLALRVEILRADLDLRALLDLVAHAPARLDHLRELRQALGVEGVGAVEELEVGLVEIDERDAFEFEPVQRRAPRSRRRAPCSAIGLPLLVQFLQRHLRGGGAHGGGEAAFQQIAQAVRLQRAPAERLRRARHRSRGRSRP